MLKTFLVRSVAVAALCSVSLWLPSVVQAQGHAHDHAEKGPHGGNLIELGDEEFHAEILVDEKANSLTVILLDKTAKLKVLSAEPKALVNLKHHDKGVQYKLQAFPMQGDPAGSTSRFGLQDQNLIHNLHHADAGAVLNVKINGKPYTGKLVLGAHDHKH